MSKFCTKCGAEHEENARFCGKCGNPFSATEVNEAPACSNPEVTNDQPEVDNTLQTEVPKKKSKKKIIAIAVGAVIVIAAILVALFATGTIGNGGGSGKKDDMKSPEGVVMAYINAIKNKDAKTLVNCMPAYQYEGIYTKELAIAMFEESLKYLPDYLKSMKASVKGVRNPSSSELYSIKSDLSYYDVDEDDITDYKYVSINLTITYEGETQTDETEILVIKYKGEWKIAEADLY